MKATYLIPESNLEELEARIEKLNRRAARLGVAPIAVVKAIDHVRHQVDQLQTGQEIGGPMTRLVWHKLGEGVTTIEEEKARCEQVARETGAFLAAAWTPTGRVMAWWKVEIDGETPSYAGWEFIATLEPLPLDDGACENLVQGIPGVQVPAEYRHRVGECDHCQAARRRNQTFVVRHQDGTHKCVGRQCIKDFLGYHGDPHQLATWAEALAQLSGLCGAAEDEDWLGGGGGRYEAPAWDLNFFLTLTACRVRKFGWVSRAVARDCQKQATADTVVYLLTPPRPSAREEERKEWAEAKAAHKPEDADSADAAAAIEWALNLPPEELEGNDYLANCNLVARVGMVTRKTTGIAASIVIAHHKAIEREINRQKWAARPPSRHVGTIGERLKFLKVTCEKVIMNEGFYGVTGIHKLTDAAGNDLVWFATGGEKIPAGEEAYIDGTVKAHDEYKGRPQTVLTRCTVWTDEGAAKELAKRAKKKAEREAKKLAMAG